jgi:hypothetical protein
MVSWFIWKLAPLPFTDLQVLAQKITQNIIIQDIWTQMEFMCFNGAHGDCKYLAESILNVTAL